MKKKLSVSLVLVVALVCALVVPAMAADAVVAPSVSYKGLPTATEVPEEVTLTAAKDFTDESKEAYDELAGAAKLSDICDNFLDVLAEVDSGLTEDKMVIRDIFEAAFEEGPVTLKFQYKLAKDKALVVLESIDGEWVALDSSKVSHDGKTVTVELEKPGVVAFVVEN